VTTNAKQPGKWPTFAAGCRVEAQFLAKQIVATAKSAQLAIVAGQHEDALILCADIRDYANSIVWQMVQAEAGIYDEAAAAQRNGRTV
jgi:hypothetical protein